MSVIDLLITIIIVTILVTIGLGVVTYVAYKLRLARRPRRDEEEDEGPRYFHRYRPESAEARPDDGAAAGTPGDRAGTPDGQPA